MASLISVVIVDDERLIRIAIRQMIDWERLGMTLVGEAANGPDALKLICEIRPDLVLLDINLPVMNGIEVCRALIQQNIHSSVLILSGYDTFEYAQQCLRLGVLDYVVKPIERDELNRALQAACGRIKVGANARPSVVEPLTVHPNTHPLVQRAIAYIQENYRNQDLSLKQISQALFVAPDYLGRTFKRSQGMTITAFITKYRMDIAMQLISEGRLKRISDVANAVGYSDALYFSKAFKKINGISPSKYF